MSENECLHLLASLSGMPYQTHDWQRLIAAAKAATDMPDDMKNDIINTGSKMLAAYNKMNQSVADLIAKYNDADSIAAEQDDDDDDEAIY